MVFFSQQTYNRGLNVLSLKRQKFNIRIIVKMILQKHNNILIDLAEAFLQQIAHFYVLVSRY